MFSRFIISERCPKILGLATCFDSKFLNNVISYSTIQLGIFFLISSIEISFIKLDKPVEIGTDKIEIDLSQNHVKAN